MAQMALDTSQGRKNESFEMINSNSISVEKQKSEFELPKPQKKFPEPRTQKMSSNFPAPISNNLLFQEKPEPIAEDIKAEQSHHEDVNLVILPSAYKERKSVKKSMTKQEPYTNLLEKGRIRPQSAYSHKVY